MASAVRFDFSGADAKVARAAALREQLVQEVDEFTATLEGEWRHEVQDGGRVHRYFVDEPRPLPNEWALVIGDIAHNARTALDHAAWQLVLAGGGTPNRQTMFPLLTERPQRAQPLEEQLPAPLWRAVEDEQPYQRGDHVHPARLIHELDRIDKHRIILPTAAVVAKAGWGGTAEGFHIQHDALADGGQLAHLVFPEPFDDPGLAATIEMRLHPDVDREVTAELPFAYVRRGDLPRWALGVGIHYIGQVIARLRAAAEGHRGTDQ